MLRNLNWTNFLFLSLSPIVAFVGLVVFFQTEIWKLSYFFLFLTFYLVTGLSITAGYHRLISHRSYKANKWVKFFYLLFGAGAFQNSAKEWCQDHRMHHKSVDTDNDPYNAQRGFWYSHIGWILEKETKPKKIDKDLANDPLIQWQDKYYLPLAVFSGILLPTFVGWLMGSALAGFVFGSAVRVVFTHHCTFFINSLCHMWGKQTYTDKNSARDNFVLAFFTYGEGYHNFHHRFEGDYRNGLKWYHFDPTKWLIRSLTFFNLAERLVRVPEEEIFKAKIRMKNESLYKTYSDKWKEDYIEKLEALRLRVEENQRKWKAVKREYKSRKDELRLSGQEKMAEMKLKIELAKIDFQNSYMEWKRYTKALASYA